MAVRGMHGAGCVRAVEEAARGVPGVLGAGVNFAAENARTEMIPSSLRLPRKSIRGRRGHPGVTR